MVKMIEKSFYSDFSIVGNLRDYSQEEIKNEPMFFSADLSFASKHGGPIVREFIEKLPYDWNFERVVLDSRTHMLMPGWFRAIPGWHLDDVPRTRKDGQPDHLNPEYYAEHISVSVGDATLTTFLKGFLTLEDVPEFGGTVYEKWDSDIRKLVKQGKVTEVIPPELAMVKFGWGSFHRVTEAKKSGWTHFIRVTRGSKREIKNEIRSQVQVYLSKENGGW